MTRAPSDKNPFKLPDELRNFPLLYRALIRPIREADQREGRQFLQRFYQGPQEVHNDTSDAIASAWDTIDPKTCPDDLLQYLKDIVGFDTDYEYITDRLDYTALRKLIRLAVPLWKERFGSAGIVNLIRLLTGRNAVLYDWFHWRAIIGETFLSEEQQGYDFWVIGGIVTYFDEYFMQVRMMDDGTLDERLVLDLLSLERVSSERIEVALVDFLDQFDLTRDKWVTLAGAPAIIEPDKTFLVPSGTSEKALMACITFSDYVVMHRFKLSTGATLRTRFHVYDWTAGEYYEIAVSKCAVSLLRYTSGTPTTVATFTGVYPQEGLWYKLRVVAVDEGGALRVKAYIDGNEVINTTDSAGPTFGEVVVGAGGSYVHIDNMEVFRIPLRLATIAPGGITETANFIWDKVCPSPPPPPPSDLIAYAKFNGGFSLDADVLAFSTLEYEEASGFNIHFDYCRGGEYEAGSYYNGAAILYSGQKFGSGYLSLAGGGNKRVSMRDYNVRGHNSLTDRRIGTISMWIKPAYSGTPGSSVGFWSWGYMSWSASGYNQITIWHDTSDGKIKASFWNNARTLIGTIASASAFNPVADTWYHVELGFDLLNGNQYLFVDGALVATGSLTGTRSTTGCDYMTLGFVDAMPVGGTHISNHGLDDLVIYDKVLHTTGFTPPAASIRDTLISPYRFYYMKGDGCTLGHPESSVVDTNTRLAIDNVNYKVGSGCLDLSNATTRVRLRYMGAGVIDDLGDTGTFQFWVKVQSATPASPNIFVDVRTRAMGTYANRQQITIKQVYSGGNNYLSVDIKNSTGVAWKSWSQPWTVVPGQWYHVEVAFDMTAPRLLIFIDGIKVADDTSGLTATRGTGALALLLGNDTSGSSSYTSFELDDLRIWDDIKHTADFSPPTTELSFIP